MPWTEKDIPDQTGRVAVVTGANGGLGLETRAALAGAGAHVVMAVRNQEKAPAAVDRIRAGVPDAALELVALDLARWRRCARRRSRSGRARAHRPPGQQRRRDGDPASATTVDGFEMQFGVDHLGHWALTALLLPALLRAPAARIVTVTSTAHHMGRAVDPANPHLRRQLRAVARVRPGQARELPLRPRAAARARARRARARRA